MKKALFYGKKSATLMEPEDEDDYFDNPAEKDIVHGILGIVTEAGELLELLLNPDKMSRAKLIDECGDHQWYHALIYRAIDTHYAEVFRKNIDKLKARFPVKFTEVNAIVRNEARENAVFQ
jgi:NTP pyrophosphatase (non-canonical NTP hydrolase)